MKITLLRKVMLDHGFRPDKVDAILTQWRRLSDDRDMDKQAPDPRFISLLEPLSKHIAYIQTLRGPSMNRFGAEGSELRTLIDKYLQFLKTTRDTIKSYNMGAARVPLAEAIAAEQAAGRPAGETWEDWVHPEVRKKIERRFQSYYDAAGIAMPKRFKPFHSRTLSLARAARWRKLLVRVLSLKDMILAGARGPDAEIFQGRYEHALPVLLDIEARLRRYIHDPTGPDSIKPVGAWQLLMTAEQRKEWELAASIDGGPDVVQGV